METPKTDSSHSIRPAKIEDLEGLRQIEFECVGTTGVPPAQLQWLLGGQGDSPSFFVRVAYEADDASEETLLGYVCWKVREQQDRETSLEILSLFVGKNFRGERVEYSLINHVIEEAIREKRLGVTVNVPQANIAATSFYLQQGFALAHSVERYFEDGSGVDVLVRRTR